MLGITSLVLAVGNFKEKFADNCFWGRKIDKTDKFGVSSRDFLRNVLIQFTLLAENQNFGKSSERLWHRCYFEELRYFFASLCALLNKRYWLHATDLSVFMARYWPQATDLKSTCWRFFRKTIMQRNLYVKIFLRSKCLLCNITSVEKSPECWGPFPGNFVGFNRTGKERPK